MEDFENNNKEESTESKYGFENQNKNVSYQVYGSDMSDMQEAPQPQPHGGMGGNRPSGRKQVKAGRIYLMAILLALLASVFGTIIASEYFAEKGYIKSETVVLYQSAQTSETKAENATYASVSESVYNTVVEIYTEAVSSSRFGEYVTEGAGSGVIISEDGYIVTNNHVIDGATSIFVRTTDGKIHNAKRIGNDPNEDIAVIKIEATGLQPAVFADSDSLVIGEEVLAVGNPLGELGGSVTNGIISAKDREIDVEGVTMNLLQTNTAINPGNSGGGLFDMNGELVGIVVAKNTGEDIDNIGFCIPSNTALKVATDMIEVGYVTGKSAIGITVTELSSLEEAKQYGFSMAGVYIVESTNSKDLQYGDLILAIDNEEITATEDIASAISGKEIGDKVKVTVLRERRIFEVEVTLVEKTN